MTAIVVLVCVAAIAWAIRELMWLRDMRRRLEELDALRKRFDELP